MTKTEDRWQQRGVRDDSTSPVWNFARLAIIGAACAAFYFAVGVAAR